MKITILKPLPPAVGEALTQMEKEMIQFPYTLWHKDRSEDKRHIRYLGYLTALKHLGYIDLLE